METSEYIYYAPTSASHYPYIVAREVDGKWCYWGAWDCYSLAQKAAIEIGGSVFHNRAYD